MKESVFKNALFTILSKNYPLSVGYAKHAPAIEEITALIESVSGSKLEADVIDVTPVKVEDEIKLAGESTDEIDSTITDVPTPADEAVSDGSVSDDGEVVDDGDEK